MGDWIDDLMGIQQEFKGMQDDFNGVASDMGASPKRMSIQEIWNPDRYYSPVGIKPDFCVHNRFDEADCNLCEEICPSKALSIDEEGNMTLKGSDCIGCGLCAAVCPTSALYSSKADPKKLYESIVATASEGQQAYVTCAKALKKNPPEGVIVVPCIGDMRRELWFSLLAAYANISIYLPIGCCDECEMQVGEEMYGDAIELAEKWARETVGFECDIKKIRYERTHGAERKEFIDGVLKSTVNVAAKANPVTAKASKALQAIDKHRNQLTGIQNTLDKLCGGEGTTEIVQTLEPNRQLLLGALKSYRDLAKGVRVDLSSTDAEVCDACGECVRTCPMGARQIAGGSAQVIFAYCVGCGLCVDVCPQGACVIRESSARKLLRELTDTEKKVEQLKKTAEDMANKATDAATKTAKDS